MSGGCGRGIAKHVIRVVVRAARLFLTPEFKQVLRCNLTPSLLLPYTSQRTSMSTRWTDTPEDLAEAARLKAEKAAKKAAKEVRKRCDAEVAAAAIANQKKHQAKTDTTPPPPSKRRKLTDDEGDDEEYIGINGGKATTTTTTTGKLRLLRFPTVEVSSCRHVDTSYERLNHIEEGSYGVVSRAKDLETGEIVALKKLKLERETDGFPITSLREIQTLMTARHPNVVNIREVVMGNTLKEYDSSSVPFPLSYPAGLIIKNGFTDCGQCLHSNGLYRARFKNTV
jgi:hypothetical protein